MSRILKTELYKLRHNKSYWLILLISIVCFLGLAYLDNTQTNVNEIVASSAAMVPLFGVVITIGIAQSDYNDGTLKNVVSSGISRMSIYIGKLITAFIGSLGVFVVEAVIGIAAAIYHGSSVQIDILFVVRSISLQAFIILNYTVIYFLIGNFIRSSALAVTLSFALNLFGTFAFGFVTNYLHVSGLMSYELGNVAAAVEKVTIENVTFMHLGALTLVIVGFAILGGYIFSKQEVK